MDFAISLSSTLFLFVCLSQIIRMIISLRFLSRPKLLNLKAEVIDHSPFYLLVPLYREQKILKETVATFSELTESDQNIRVVFITTQKEVCNGTEETTGACLSRLIHRGSKCEVFHCPNNQGTMATQLNYAVARIENRHEGGVNFGIFNADSRPGLNSIQYAKHLMNTDPTQVIQQYSYYTFRYEPRPRKILAHLALWQTKWTLHFELGRVLVDQWLRRRLYHWGRIRKVLLPFNYVIGHGLFMSSATWRQAGGFPEDEICEDAFLSLILYGMNKEVTPLPFLEEVDFAPTLGIYLKQQAVWYCGPMYAPRYFVKLLRRSGKLDAIPELTIAKWSLFLFIGAFKLHLHAWYWLLGPPIQLVLIPFILFSRGEWFLLMVWTGMSLTLNYLFHQIICYRMQSSLKLGLLSEHCVLPAVFAYLLHCVGPTIAIMRALTFGNDVKTKYKTERAANLVLGKEVHL